MTALLLVSHSAPLAQAAAEAALAMIPSGELAIGVAAGAPGGEMGTDATEVAAQLERLAADDDVLVLTDIGSSVMAAETAVELIPPELRDRALISHAPLIEGLFAAALTAAMGAPLEDVAAEAEAAYRAKGGTDPGEEDAVPAPPDQAGPTQAGGEKMRVSFTLTNTHGLHARPAALLVAQVRASGCEVRARNVSSDSAWADASSVTQMTTLGARRGELLEFEASGPAAQRVLNALVDLAKENFGEGDHAPGQPPAPLTPPDVAAAIAARSGTLLPASPGYAVGPVRHLSGGEFEIPESDPDDPATQWSRLMAAFEDTRVELAAAKVASAAHGGPGEAAIFDAHTLMLEDAALLHEARRRIDEGQGVAKAWDTTMTTLAVRIGKLDDAYLRSRAADVRGLRDQVLRHLLGAPPPEASGPGILVVADLSPAEAATLDPAVTHGVVLAAGSPTSHAAILARSLGMPMVTGAGPRVMGVPEGTQIAIDGGAGEIAIDPPADVVARYRERIEEREKSLASARTRASSPARTKDGIEVPVRANIGAVPEAAIAAAAGADGSGLVRTEFLFAGRKTAPSRAEQEAVYREIAEAFGGRRVVIRTLDAGGDKPIEYLNPPLEANPFLGVRGIRLALRHPRVLVDQLAAISAVAEDHPVSVMFPMVTDVTELIQARRALAQASRERGRPMPPSLRVGIMIEVPAAALKAGAFAPLVDFFSIGTNDLTQYAMAAERGNPALGPLADPLDPAMLRLISAVCRGARGRARVAVCGEMAADPEAIPFLLGLGVTSLSVPAPSVAEVKDRVREVRVSSAVRLAAKARRLRDAIAVRALVS